MITSKYLNQMADLLQIVPFKAAWSCEMHIWCLQVAVKCKTAVLGLLYVAWLAVDCLSVAPSELSHRYSCAVVVTWGADHRFL